MAENRGSGGKRAVERKRAADQAARNRDGDYAADWGARYSKLGPAPLGEPERAHQWLADAVLLAIQEAMADHAMPPAQRREQIARLAAQAAKVIDPAKLAAKLAAYERVVEELRDHAAPIATGSNGGTRPPPTIS